MGSAVDAAAGWSPVLPGNNEAGMRHRRAQGMSLKHPTHCWKWSTSITYSDAKGAIRNF
jgi:hypothetical protein